MPVAQYPEAMPHQTEPTVNVELGNLLQGMMGTCLVRSEHTGLIVEQHGAQIDNLITAVGRSPVVVEAEFMPSTGEADAMGRLGKHIVDQPRPVEAAIALRYPVELKTAEDLESALREAKFSYCVLYDERDDDDNQLRFPESGWLEGGLDDLADLIRLVSVPEKAVNDAADSLQAGIRQAAVVLDGMAETQPHVVRSVADMLGMRNVPQTRRMACAIIANALIFHERIAGMHEGINPLLQVCGPDVANPQIKTLTAWDAILKINYFPIFAIARDLLRQFPSGAAKQILDQLRDTAQEVDAAGVDNARDLTGRIFQRLISDRKYLATFYTRPASAALLARLAVAKLKGIDWSDPEAVARLRVGDFACGTGALLSAVYEQIGARHERAGGDPAELHAVMVEDTLYGCDVMPSAVHITSATLSGAYPNIGYSQSRIYALRYGRQQDGSVKVGSLVLLQSSREPSMLNTSDPDLRAGSTGELTAEQVTVEIQDGGFDLVIMNPPFTSNTKHFDAEDGVLNAAFAAFDTSEADQADMAKELKKLARGTAYHGHAGQGSAFASVADRKLKPGGVIALVLPFTAINGSSWKKFRDLIANEYEDLSIVSIAANGDDMSFSSDTGMAECLVIGRKRAPGQFPPKRSEFVSLRRRPDGVSEAHVVASGVIGASAIRKIEDGPFGGTRLSAGDQLVGEVLSAPIDNTDSGWGAARIKDYTLAQVGASLAKGELWLPAQQSAIEFAIAELSDVGERGVDSQLLISAAHKGPFDKVAPSTTATYPALWNHNAERESRMLCVADSSMVVKQGMEDRAAELWQTAGRAHVNRDFTFGSQALAVAFTEHESLGGRVWPNVTFEDSRFEYAMTIWGNSTLGLLMYWWYSSRQQSSKATLTIKMFGSLPILDLRELDDDQHRTAEDIFNDFRDRELQPAYLADADPNRALLDRRLICDMLDFDESVYEGVRRLAAKWCAEPSVHGGKARPPGSVLVI